MKIEIASFRNKVRKILSNFPNLNPEPLINEIVAAAESCIEAGELVEEPKPKRVIPPGTPRIDGHLVLNANGDRMGDTMGVRVETLCGKVIMSEVPVAAHHDTKGDVTCNDCL